MGYTLYKTEAAPVIRGVLFDMDGLVLDTEKLYTRFWIEACAHFGFSMSLEQALRMRAANRALGRANILEFFGPQADYTAIRAKRIERMNAFIEENGIEAKPGIRELLHCLREWGIPTAITSSSPVERIQTHLERVGLLECFDRLCSGYDVPQGKPAPDIYLKGAAVLGLAPEECLALEDAPTGITAAYRAGCVTVMVPDQDQPEESTIAMLHAKADSLTDVISLLEAIR